MQGEDSLTLGKKSDAAPTAAQPRLKSALLLYVNQHQVKDFLSLWDVKEIKLLRDENMPETHEERIRKLLDASK